MNKPISNATGVYFTERDNTVVTQSIGTFAGAIVGNMEKGPAFEIMPSSTFQEREIRMGGLNDTLLSDGVSLKYPSSYYALNFLEQASNLKEVRVLGLEGYNELTGNDIDEASSHVGEGYAKNGTDKSFVVMYATPSTTSSAATVGGFPYDSVNNSGEYDQPTIADKATVAAVLKPRRTAFTGKNQVYTINISATGTNLSPLDNSFNVTIIYDTVPSGLSIDPLVLECSLRPEDAHYIGKVFGRSPLDNTKVNGNPSPLWVDFVYDSVKTKNSMMPYLDSNSEPTYIRPVGSTPNPGSVLGYRYPGQIATDQSTYSNLALIEGDCIINSEFIGYPVTSFISSATIGKYGNSNNPIITVTWAAHGFSVGDRVRFTDINNAGLAYLNGKTFTISSVGFAAGYFNLEVTLVDWNSITIAINTASGSTSWNIQQMASSVWETEVMNLGGAAAPIEFRTPATPWFVSDTDANGQVKKLFKVWSVSDGDNANTEIKIEIANINPAGNAGDGSFDLLVRNFADSEESKIVYEGYTNLSLNPKSDSYIARRIGDGETYPLKGRFIFVEMNIDDVIAKDSLPFGIDGYANVDGMVLPDVVWSTEYNLSQPIGRQILGLPKNNINTKSVLTADYLSYKNVPNIDSTNTGIGFHLNPTSNANFATLQSTEKRFLIADRSIYWKSGTDLTAVGGLDKAKRNKFVVALSGGFDGWNVYSERTFNDGNSLDYTAFKKALEVLSDKESIDADFSVLVTPDINFEQHSAAAKLALELVESREDALYLFDFAYDSTGVCDPNIAKANVEGSEMLSNYAATYYPHWQVSDPVNKSNSWIAPSFVALGTIASVAVNEAVWQPPAGSLRTVESHLVRPRRRMKHSDREILEGANINPITIFPGSGIEITDSKTTQDVFSALSFIHNRMLLNYAKKALNQALRPLLQQLNSSSLRDAFENVMFPIFDRIKKQNGIEDFKVTVTDVVEDRTTLYGTIEIIPLYPVRKISITFSLENSTISFSQ